MTPPPSSQRKQLKSCLRQRKSCMKQEEELVVAGEARQTSSYGYALAPSSGASSPNTRRRNKRCIAFGRLEIHEFPIILGDNPSCSDGAPLTVGWNCVHHMVFDIEYYETYNPSECRRRKDKMKLSVAERSEILLNEGYSMMDIVGRTLEVLKTKQNRADSYRSRKWEGIHQAIETTTKTIRKAARRSSLLTVSTAEVLISPLKSPRKKVARLKSGDRVTLSSIQRSLEGAALAA